MICHLLILLFPVISISQYYNPSLYQSYMNAGVPRQQTVLVPVYTQGGYGGAYGGYPSYGQSYGQSYPSYGMGMGYGYAAGYPMMGGAGGACCGGTGMGMMPPRESNAKKFLRGATEGVFMGSVGMLGFRK